MKKTTSSLFAATAALGLIAASAGVAFAAETPAADQPSTPATEAPATETPSTPATEDPAPEQPSAPATEDPAPEQPSDPADNNTGGSSETPAVSDDSSVPAADQGGAGAVSGPVGTTGVTTRGQISTGNGPAPVSARGGIRNTNAPAGTPAASNPTLANTGSVASIAAGAGVIALAGGVTLVVARKRH